MIYNKNTFSKQLLIACTIFFVLSIFVVPSYAQKFSENEVKAAFIYKVTKFIRWNNKGNIVFCSIGDEQERKNISVANAFDKITEDKTPSFTVRQNVTINKIDECNIIYIEESNASNLKNIFSLTADKPIVTFSSIQSFSRRGGMFGFISDSKGRVKLELNKNNAELNKVNVKSSLLEIIKIVE